MYVVLLVDSWALCPLLGTPFKDSQNGVVHFSYSGVIPYLDLQRRSSPRFASYLRMDPGSAKELLDSVEGEISLFRSVMKARPVGLHKHFHVLAIRTAIWNDIGRVVPIECIWEKLRSCYDLDALETAVGS